MKKTELTYGNILVATALLSALPLDVKVKEKEGEYTRSLSDALTGRVLSLVANLGLLSKRYNELEENARKAAKKEGFDERFSAYQEKKKENEGHSDADFEKEIAETERRFNKAVEELREQKVALTPQLFSKKEFEEITAHTKGADIKMNGIEVARLHWLIDFGQILVAE